MRNLLIIVLLYPLVSFGQDAKTLLVHGDTLFYKNLTQNDSIQLTRLQMFSGNSGKFLSTDGLKYVWSNGQDLSGYSSTSHTHAYADITSKPTLFDGIFSSLTSKPTTLSGYGITNGVANTITVNGHALSGNVSVTTADLSLDNVTNTSDASKPVSTAQQTALNLKANLASPTFTGTVSGVTAAMVGLGNVTNESKATMFTNSTFTGTFSVAAGSIANAALANAAVANLSGTNTGDNAVNSNYSGLVSNATHTGDATGATALTVVKINGTSLAGLATGILKNTTTTGVPSIAAQADVTALLGAGSITNTMLANAAVANLSGTNTGDQTITLTGDVTGTGTGSFAATIGATKVTNAMLAGSITSAKLVGTDIATLARNSSYNGITSVSNGLSQIVATIDATTQAANIGTATLYAVPSAGFYRVSIYITVTQAATTSSTMPSTTIAYTDGNSGTNSHSTTTTATNASNSLTTSFAQTTYVLYAKASTNITYATGSYASTGATVMQYALRIKVESL